jgi:hypothetical protein
MMEVDCALEEKFDCLIERDVLSVGLADGVRGGSGSGPHMESFGMGWEKCWMRFVK